jgi:hypothetical protein
MLNTRLASVILASALDADGADEQAHFGLLMRKDMLDPGANAGFGRVAAPDMGGHRLALGFPAMNAADPPLGFEPTLVALAAIGRIPQTSEAVLSLVTTSRNIRPS